MAVSCRLRIPNSTATIYYINMQLFAMSWSPDGKLLATIARDHVIRIYDPRNSTSPVNEGVGPEGSRGARIVWLNNTHLAVSGFNK